MWKGSDFEVTWIGPNTQVAQTTYDKEVFYFQFQGSSALTLAGQGEVVLPASSMIVLQPGTTHSSRVRRPS